MKKILLLLLLLSLLIGCKKEPSSFINGGWTLYLTNPTGRYVSWFVCFDVNDIINGDIINPNTYFCDEYSCFDCDANYLTMFDFRKHDSTLLVKVTIDSPDNYGGSYMYYGKYLKDKDIFVGATDYTYPDKPGAYYMCSNNDSITRGIIFR